MKSKAFKIINKIKNILLTVILVLLVIVVAASVFIKATGNTPSIGGYMLFRVATGSMEPEIMIGDVILVKEPSDYSAIAVGDVVTYESRSGVTAGRPVTHKVIKAPYEDNGEWYLQTQGVANDIPDEEINAEQLLGVMVVKIPFLKELYAFFLTPWGLLTIIALIIIAFAGEFINVVKVVGAKPDDDKTAVEIAVERVMAQQKEAEQAMQETHETSEAVKENDSESNNN